MQPQPEHTIGRYVIKRVTGDVPGIGFGLHAYDPVLCRDVHILLARYPAEDDVVSRSLRKAGRLMASVHHPAYVQVFDVGSHDGHTYVAMESIANGILDFIRATGPWEWSRAVGIVRRVAEALGELHQLGRVHTGLTNATGNVLWDEQGNVRVSGVQWSVQIGGSPEILPRHAYLPPELLTDPPDIRPTNDIWCLGVILVSLLCGVEHFAEAIPLVATLDGMGTIPHQLSELCARCVADDPAERPQSCSELVEAFDALVGTKPPGRVFISHASADREVVEDQVVRLLETCGYRTWYARNDIRSAKEWEQSILAGLQASEWFLVVVSANSAKSNWVKDELFWAIDERPDRIIPVVLDETEPRDFHIRLGRLQSIDLRDSEASRHLLDALRHVVANR